MSDPGKKDPPGPLSALADAIHSGSVAVARSHRLHRRRGGFCARGYCHQCPVWTEGGTRLACEVPAGARGGGRLGVGLDPLRPLGLIGQRATPWFWERRFRRPRPLRQTYLRTLRHLSSAPSLPFEPAADPGSPAPDLETDVLVVGGGPCGLAAAALLSESGASVVVVSRGSGRGIEPPPGADRNLERLRAGGATLLEGSFCLGVEHARRIALVEREGRVSSIGFERLVVATGAYDRLPLVPGNDLPGLIGLRAFERLAAQGAFVGRLRVGVVASGSELERGRGAATRFGIDLAWHVDAADPSERLVRVLGRRRVRGAELAVSGRRRCDVLVVAGMQPTFELQVQAGLEPIVRGSPAVIRTLGDAPFPLLVVGEAAGIDDPTRARSRAAEDAAAWSGGEEVAGEAANTTPRTDDRRAADPHPLAHVCLCEDVRVRDVTRAVAEGYDQLELLKRRTGATTGPCQGKLCLGPLCDVVASLGVATPLPTVRPPIRPVRIATLGGPS